MRRILKKGDIIAITAVLLSALLIWTVQLSFAASPQNVNTLLVKIVSENGEDYFDLSENADAVIDSNGVRLVVSVCDGTVFVTESSCPDKICVLTGAISDSSRAIACLPAGVVISIVGGDTADADFIAG